MPMRRRPTTIATQPTKGVVMFLGRTPSRIRRPLMVGMAGACAVALFPSAGEAAPGVQTLRYYVRDVSMTITHADGTVVRRAPYPPPTSGDVLELNGIDYVGDHRRHAAKWTASQTERCVFAEGPPDCQVIVAIGGSLLVFRGSPGTLVNGTGRYQGATGRVLTVKMLKGGVDVTARVRLRS
jgi:hypothetical protein